MIREEVQSIKAQTSLVDIAKADLDLLPQGSEWACQCPFHHEKTASCRVNDQRFHCFGCGAHGDVVDWLRGVRGVSFPEALALISSGRALAAPRSVSTPKGRSKHSQVDTKASMGILRANENYQVRLMLDTFGMDEVAKAYINSRFSETATRFGIGYADLGGAYQYEAMDPAYQSAGLVIQDRRGVWYPRYRDRITIPLTNKSGDILGFQGRKVPRPTDTDNIPKYLLPPSTHAFTKKRYVYGLQWLDESPAHIVVVEGVIDCIQLLDRGVKNVVSTLGCHITEEQMRILEHYTKRILVLFDGDKAGYQGAYEATKFLDSTCSIDLLLMPHGQDPDSFCQQPGDLKQRLKELPRIPATYFYSRRLMSTKIKPEYDRSVLDEMVQKYVDKNIEDGYPQMNVVDWVMAAFPEFSEGTRKSIHAMMSDADDVNGKKRFKKERVEAFLTEWKKPCREVRINGKA